MCNSDNNSADGAGVDPDKQQLLRQLKAGESVLTRVRQEKNKLQDANIQLEQGKPRKLFNKCCPYHLNTSPSFKEKSPRL